MNNQRQEGKRLPYRYYDIYGFLIAVEDSISGPFEDEYRRFRMDNHDSERKIDLLVRRTDKVQKLPTKLLADSKGILLPFGENGNEVLCDEGVGAGFIFNMVEPFINWKDKCFMHAGAVSKNGRAMIFPAALDTGKTSTVMQLLQKGYDYLSDEWVVLDRKAIAYPFPKKIHIINHNLEGDKAMVLRAMNGNHVKYYLYRWYFRLWLLLYRHFPVRRVRALLGFFRPILFQDIQELLPDVNIGQPSSISHIFFLQRAQVTEIAIDEMDSDEVARRMAFWNLFEKREFIKEYYLYASTMNKHNSRIEGMLDHEMGIMRQAFQNARVFGVSLPDKSLYKETYRQLAAKVDNLFNLRD
jgi:hypothetical protein